MPKPQSVMNPGMEVLVPIDGSAASDRALAFAMEFADNYDATLCVVHISDTETEATEQILDRAEEVLDMAGIDETPELVAADIELRPAQKVGEKIVELIDERDCDHVVMGHGSSDAVSELIVGSTAKTVIRNSPVPVTVYPADGTTPSQ